MIGNEQPKIKNGCFQIRKLVAIGDRNHRIFAKWLICLDSKNQIFINFESNFVQFLAKR